jgi:hypothetical protein
VSTSGTYPVAEMISLDVIETLAKVKLAGDYHVDLSVERRRRPFNQPRHMLAVLHEGDDEPAGDDESSLGDKYWVRPYGVQIFVFGSELDSEDLYHQVLNMARADVHKALMQDVTRGGWAWNTEIGAPQEFDAPGDAGGVIVYFDVHYRHKETDPYARVQDGAP